MKIANFLRAALLATTLLAGLSQTAHADITTHTGNTTGGPTYNRTDEFFSGLSVIGTDVAYSTLTFSVSEFGDYTFLTTAAFDSMIFLYENSFDPTAPLTNALIGNDDALNTRTSGFGATLTDGVTYVFVMTGYENSDFGFHSTTIGGPGLLQIPAVPEPATYAMLMMGLAGVVLVKRRKQAGR